MGDQIYADATAGLFDPTNLDDRYVRPYEKLFGSDAVKSVLRRLPAFMLLDDHEVADNWERDADAELTDRSLEARRQSYFKYQRTMLPPGDGRAWFSFNAGGLPFFMADTRSEREARTPSTVAQARMMGRRQWAELRLWLRRQQRGEPAAKPKFIVSASIVAPRRLRAAHGGAPAHCLRSDAWDGYPALLQALLAFVARRQIQNVVFLSGDEHISLDATIRVTPPGGPVVAIRSIHSSGLYSPFPFANARRADLADDDRFEFPDPRHGARAYQCTVHGIDRPGDGFAVVRVAGAASGWALDCRFDRAP